MKLKIFGLIICLVILVSFLATGLPVSASSPQPAGCDVVCPGGGSSAGDPSPPAGAVIASDNGYGESSVPDDPSPANYPNGQYVWSGQEYDYFAANAFFKFDVPAHLGYNGMDPILFGAYSNYRLGDDDVSAVYYFADNSWSQATLTWNSPWNTAFEANHGPIVSSVSIPSTSPDQYFEFNVTSAAANVWKNGGTITLVVTRPNPLINTTYWRDWENLLYDGTEKPYLVSYGPVPAVPEMPGGILLAMGLAGVGGFIFIKRRVKGATAK